MTAREQLDTAARLVTLAEDAHALAQTTNDPSLMAAAAGFREDALQHWRSVATPDAFREILRFERP